MYRIGRFISLALVLTIAFTPAIHASGLGHLMPAIYLWQVKSRVEFGSIEFKTSDAKLVRTEYSFPEAAGTACLYSPDGKLLTAKHNLMFDKVQALADVVGIKSAEVELWVDCSVTSSFDGDRHGGSFLFKGVVREGQLKFFDSVDQDATGQMKLLSWKTYGDYAVLKIPVEGRRHLTPVERLEFGSISLISLAADGNYRLGHGTTGNKVEEVRLSTLEDPSDVLPINARVREGDSGGAVVDGHGNLVAMIVAIDLIKRNTALVIPVTSMNLP